ncbi:hypothetical protein H4Q26_001265 [Puccinia striiformis f. sp. tritici PST-130]|nr:hypothetical protein H4Q26_001265 [Puccinia striiformis f. sp. tritici PST-130]
MAELDPTITGLESAVEELRRERDLQIKQLGNLVVEGFRSLARKHNLPHEPIGRHEATDPISTQESPSPSEVDSKKQLLIRLHSTLLPSLLSQFTSLHQAFSPMIIWRDTPTQLRITGETLIQIDHTLDEITSVVDSICPTRPPTPNQTDDHDLYELKNYRLHGLDHWIKVNSGEISVTLFSIPEYILWKLDSRRSNLSPTEEPVPADGVGYGAA